MRRPSTRPGRTGSACPVTRSLRVVRCGDRPRAGLPAGVSDLPIRLRPEDRAAASSRRRQTRGLRRERTLSGCSTLPRHDQGPGLPRRHRRQSDSARRCDPAEPRFRADSISTSDDWGAEKPAPESFTALVAECAVPAQHIAYVGDRLDNDIRPALDAGLVTAIPAPRSVGLPAPARPDGWAVPYADQ
jgi:hypothetical protein